MSVVTELAADLVALRRALGVSEEMSIEAIVCAALLMRQENRELEPLARQLRDREDELEAANARAQQNADLVTELKVRFDACQALLDDERKETAKFQRLTEILHQMHDEGSATVIDVLEEVKRRVALEDAE